MKNNSYFDLSIFEKIEDIIYLDEPILSHLKLKGKEYFLYLVDNKEDSDIFIFFDIKETDIYRYLTKSVSLRELIKDNNFILLLEQDFEGNIIDSQTILSNNISEDYLPDFDSFLEYEPLQDSYYFKKIAEYNSSLYLQDLRKNAFYINFSTNDKKFGYTMGLREITNTLLRNLSISFKNFVEIDFEKHFDKIIPDDTKRTSILRAVLTDTDLRMVDLNYSSFEIGLSTDKMMKTNIEFKEVREWADNVGDNYKKVVLDEDIDNEELASILESYTEDERNKIFEPVVRIVENENYNFKIKSSSQKEYKNLGLKKKKFPKKIITKNKIKEESPQKHLELISVTTIIDTNSKKKTINLENTLFNTVQETEHKLTNDDFKKYGYSNVPSDLQIILHLENNNSLIVLKANYNNILFDIVVENDKIDEGIRKMIEKIYEYIVNLK